VAVDKVGIAFPKASGQHRVKATCQIVIILSFSFILIFGPIFYGAVENWQAGILIVAAIFLFLVWAVSELFSKDRTSRYFDIPRIVYGLPVMFVLLAVFQVIPLSHNILGFFSPVRLELNRITGIDEPSTISVAPHATNLWLFRVIAYSIVFIVAAHVFADRRHALRLVGLVVILGYLLALYGLLQYLSDYSLPSLFAREHSPGRVAGTYVNSNHFAGYLEMCIPLALSVIFRERGRESDRGISLGRRVIRLLLEKLEDRKVLLPLTAVVIMSLAVLFSMSRMGIFSFLVSLIVFALLIGKTHRKTQRAVVLGCVIAIVLLVSVWLGLDAVSHRFSLLSGDEVKRINTWKMTGNVIRNYAFLGTGLGTFGYISPNYQTPDVGCRYWEEAHNDYISLTSDTGTVGLAIGILFLVAWYAYVFRLLTRKHIRAYQRSIAAGCIAGVTAIVVHSISDFNLQIPANAFYFATLLGLGIAVLRIKEFHYSEREPAGGGEAEGAAQTRRRHTLRKLVLCIVAVFLSVFIAPMVVRSALAEHWLQRAASEREPQARIQTLRKSLELDPDLSESYYELGKIEYMQRSNYEKAKDYFEKAVRRTPCVGKNHYWLGLALARLGNDNDAEREFELAMKLAPMHPDVHYKVAFYHFFKYRRTKNTDSLARSLLEFRKAAEISPSYLTKSLNLLNQYLVTYSNLKDVVPDSPCGHFSFAEWLAARGKWKAALSEYLRAGEENLGKSGMPDKSEFHLKLGRAYLMKGDVLRAKEAYLEALERANTDRMFRVLYEHFAEAKRLVEGISFFEGLLRQFPDFERLPLNIGRAYLALGDLKRAEKYLRQSLTIRDNEEAFCLLYEVAMRWREYSLAEFYIGKALAFNSGNPEYHCSLAQAMEGSGNLKSAVEELEQSVKLDPNTERYHRELERVEQRLLFKKN
jgi:tetratricopeptide (TPR) repeat protein